MSERPAKKPNKSAFVRSLPQATSAKEVVAKAKAAGMKISEAYVYAIRSSSRARAGKAPGVVGRPRGSGSRAAEGASTASTAAGARGAEATFRKLVLDLGIRRSRALLDEVESKLARLIAGN